MKNAQDLLVELYAWKLTKYDLLDACQMWKKEPEYKLGGSLSKRCKEETLPDMRKATQRFMNPVFDGLRNNQVTLPYYYQKKLFYLLENALINGIIDTDGNILNKKQFVNEVLKKCILPDISNCMTVTSQIKDQYLFHSLTNFDFAHIIQEQINHADTSDYATQYKIIVKEHGPTGNFYTLWWAISDRGYRNFVTEDEVRKTVGKGNEGLLNLCKTIVSRMSAHEKKS